MRGAHSILRVTGTESHFGGPRRVKPGTAPEQEQLRADRTAGISTALQRDSVDRVYATTANGGRGQSYKGSGKGSRALEY